MMERKPFSPKNHSAENSRLVGRNPCSARVPLDPLPRPTGASAADQGVRPTYFHPLWCAAGPWGHPYGERYVRSEPRR